ncbi:MAG: sulfite exporter TauE/SafE family protein [Phycisphaeraceae bacterium]|nr:MAG: sulfite exporter TauE/SafE family protein [Phycisphaeraceae bacterium]
MGTPFDMLTLAGAVLVASVLGSTHCAGMCGGLVLFAVGADGKLRRHIPLHAAYHAGRGITYTLLGVVAGSIGAAVDFSGRFAGFQRSASLIAGGAMIVFGLVALVRALGFKLAHAKLPARYTKLVEKGHRFALGLPPIQRAWAVGLLTTLLPCGWLYAFAITAAGTASPFWGGMVLLAFWVGTLPMMVTLGAGLQALTGPLRSRLPFVTALIVIAVGLLTVLGRIGLPSFVPESVARMQPTSVRESIDQVRSLDSSDLPCCNAPPGTIDP